MNLDINLKMIFDLKWPMTGLCILNNSKGILDAVQLKPTMRYIPAR